ncbi:MAG: type VI secretion system baseplate subunit TssE [Pseudomonadota bacterium]
MALHTSLLDRLIDEAPDRPRDQPLTRTEEIWAVRNGFRRDLEALLNTRRLCRTPPKAFHALRSALPFYGTEDFVGAPIATQEQRQDFAASIERTIRLFEPRFLSVKVIPVRARDPAERRQLIRIEAVVRLEHGPEPVVFDSALDWVTRRFTIEQGWQDIRS